MTDNTNKPDNSKRKLLGLGAAAALSPIWAKPVVNVVLLPAHAQTSPAMCVTDTTVGGPLAGHPSGAATCQVACESEATDRGAELCDVRETTTGGSTDCACDLDLP